MKRAGEITRYLRLNFEVPADSSWRVLEAGIVVDQTYLGVLKKELKATYGPRTNVSFKVRRFAYGGSIVEVPIIVARQKRLDVEKAEP